MSRKARNCQVRIVQHAPIDDFWRAMDATFAKHGTKPTHTQEEYTLLASRFPGRIWADVAYLDATPVAGVGYFAINRRVNSSFYLCQDPGTRPARPRACW